MIENFITCAYCLDEHENTSESISSHILSCPKRPEVGLTRKIQSLEITGDAMLKVIRALVETLGEIQGMRSTVWKTYRTAEEEWEKAKND